MTNHKQKTSIQIICADPLKYANNFETKEFDLIIASIPYHYTKRQIVRLINLYLEKTHYLFVPVIWSYANKKTMIEVLYQFRDYYNDTLIWNKQRGRSQKASGKIPTIIYENIHVFCKWNNTRAIGTKQWYGTVDNLITISTCRYNVYDKHFGYTFNQPLADWMIGNFVKPGGKVLDLFAAGGQSGYSCVDFNISGVMLLNDRKKASIVRQKLEYYLKLKQNGSET